MPTPPKGVPIFIYYPRSHTSTNFYPCYPHRVWPSGRLSTRSKSMTSFSGESYHEDHLPIITTGRCHTALGIYSSKPQNYTPPPSKKSPEKSISLLLSNSNSPSLSPEFMRSILRPPSVNCVNDQPDSNHRDNTRHDIYLSKYDENRNLSYKLIAGKFFRV